MERYSVTFWKMGPNGQRQVERVITRDHWFPCHNMVHHYVGHERHPIILAATAYDNGVEFHSKERTVREFEAQVAAGLALIGSAQSEIDLERLDLKNRWNCVLGQIYGEYCIGCRQMGENLNHEVPAFGGFVCEHGFMLPEELQDDRDNWVELTNEWKIQITAKRQAV